MKTLTRYILGQLFFTVLAILFMLVCIAWLAYTLRYVELVANRGVSFDLFLTMVLCILPSIFVIVLPISFFIGTLFVYNKFVTDHEIVVMQAAGANPWQLAKPVSVLAVFFTAVLYFFTLYLSPLSAHKWGELTASLSQDSFLSFVCAGQFDTLEKHTVYAKSQDAQGNFLGVLIYDASQKDKSIVFMAEKGTLFNKGEGQRILLTKGSRQDTDIKTGRTSILYFDQYTIETQREQLNTPKLVRRRSTEEHSVRELLYPQEPLSPSRRLRFLLVAHQRLIAPLYVSAFGLMGVSVILLGYFNRRGRVGKIVMACVIATTLELAITMCMQRDSYLELMIVLSYLVITATIVISLFLLSPLAEGFFKLFLPRRRS